MEKQGSERYDQTLTAEELSRTSRDRAGNDIDATAHEIAALLRGEGGGTMVIVDLLETYRNATFKLIGPICDAYRHAERCGLLVEADDGIHVSVTGLQPSPDWQLWEREFNDFP
jgi:hypothetical protein